VTEPRRAGGGRQEAGGSSQLRYGRVVEDVRPTAGAKPCAV